jgi:serine/threonine protein kinase
MKSRLASVRAAGGLDRVDGAVQLLEDEWQQHGDVQLRQFWNQPRCRAAVDSGDAIDVLAELVKADLRCRFERGQTPAVADYLEQFPELRAADSRVLSLVYEEYCLNEERGAAPDLESFCDRYPDWKSSLVSQLQYHRLFSQAAGGRPSRPRFPEAGQDFEEFRLQSLLGSGGMSRVFLARDLSLGGKQVVLKVTLDRGQEPKVQGSLDHPHIVPVNSVAYPADGELCGLSMPYWPGLSLDKLIAFIDPASRPRKAIKIWRELLLGTRYSANSPVPDESSTGTPATELHTAPRGDGWEGFPVRGSYAQGVAWLAMIVARALHYAHGKQTFHRDVKPGNILLTLHNGPQLLDFNLAESPHSADHAKAALHGGTLPYMAPEQIEAFINPDLWDKVGASADIYSLGLVFRELLTGQKPELPEPSVPPARAFRAVLDRRPFLDPSVRRLNPAIPHALEAIVAKCLSLAPENRYADARALEEDLDRFLKNEPLSNVVNPSRRERMGNWMTRRRGVLSISACMLAAAVAYPVIAALIPPPFEKTPAFLSAVRSFEMEQPAIEAVARFRSLEHIDSRSCLLKFYLGFALKKASLKPDGKDEVKRFIEGDRYVREALAAPDLEKSAKKWVDDHFRFVTYLVDFAEHRMQRVDKLAEDYDHKSPVEDEVRDRELRQGTYQLALDALRLAEKLNPRSAKTQRLLATTEKYFDEFAPAYDRISRVIGSFDRGTNNDMLFFSRELRGWLANAWAEQEKEKKKIVPETRSRLVEADEDYAYCENYLIEHDFKGTDQVRKKYYVSEHRLRMTVTLAEVEEVLSLREDAQKHLAEAERALVRVNDYIRSTDLKVGTTAHLEERLKHLRIRLQTEPTPSDLVADGLHLPH